MSTSVSVTGNLTRDPELRFTQGGQAVCSFGIAVNRGKDKPGEFFDVTVWEEQAECVAESLTKGDRVMVIGRLSYRTWETDGGDKRSKVEIVAYEVGPSLRWARVTGIEKLQRGDGGGSIDNPVGRGSGQRRGPARQEVTYDYGDEPF